MEEIINVHFGTQSSLYFSSVIKSQDYDIYYSDVIDDEYWNIAYLKNNDVQLKEIFNEIKKEMVKSNKRPVIYITSNIMSLKLQEEIESLNIEPLYTDVWMTLDNLEKFGTYKSKIDFTVNRVDKNLKEQFINAVMNGFSGDDPEEPYQNLSEGYKIAIDKSFGENDSEYKVIHYLGIKGEESVSTATVIYRNNKAIIYNVTTNKKYQRQGVCKKMMSDIIQDLIKLNIDEVCVQTEQGFYTEKVYKKMGFKEKIIGKAYIEKE